MKKQSVLPEIVLILVLVISVLGFQVWTGHGSEAQGTSLKVVNPLNGGNLFDFTDVEKSVGDTFVVNVTVVDVTDLYGWQIYFTWDPSLLNFSSVELPSDNVFAGQTVVSVILVESEHIIYGVDLAPGMNSFFNGTGTLCQITLKITQSVSPSVPEVSCDLKFANLVADTFLLNSQLGSIPFVAFNGVYDYTHVRPPSSTSIFCSPNPVSIGLPVNCTAAVNGSNPTGTINWSTSSIGGSFSHWTSNLSNGTCSTTYTDNFTGSVNITASYSGDSYNAPSSRSMILTVFENVTVGTNVTVQPTSNLGLTFANVTVAGVVVANETPTVRAPPLNNTVGQYYDVNVTASYSGNVTVSLAFDGSNMTQQQKSNLKMMQYRPLIAEMSGPTPGVPDGVVNMRDIAYIVAHFNTVPNSSYWDPTCDIYGPSGVPDGVVNMRDIAYAVACFGQTSTWQNITANVDTTNNLIYGQTNHFSFIGIHG